MNSFTFKGISSLIYPELIVQELPPITSAEMRFDKTEIDGKDGAIFTELGLSNYYKTMSIGLVDASHLDTIIAWLKGTGVVIFSNEPDKYYNARIYGQIDYSRLGRFKTALVTFIVEPYKYKLGETLTQLLTVTNQGNVPSKPYIKITGSGTVTLKVNAITICTLTIGSLGYLELDSETEECYLGGTLKNRLMNGKFPIFQIGTNVISTTGTVTKVETLVRSRFI